MDNVGLCQTEEVSKRDEIRLLILCEFVFQRLRNELEDEQEKSRNLIDELDQYKGKESKLQQELLVALNSSIVRFNWIRFDLDDQGIFGMFDTTK